jgi:hypothetical protein
VLPAARSPGRPPVIVTLSAVALLALLAFVLLRGRYALADATRHIT